MGKALVATGWGGPGEYMTEENSYPLNHRGLFERGAGGGPFPGHKFAEPDVYQLRERMLWLSTRGGQEDAAVKGVSARKDMLDKYSSEKLGGVLALHFSRIKDAVLRKDRDDDDFSRSEGKGGKKQEQPHQKYSSGSSSSSSGGQEGEL